MFKRPSIRYGQTPEPATPYQRAAQAWDDRIGSARVQAKNWRLAFFGTLALSGGLAGGLVWQSTRGHIVPWVVQIDRLGEAQAVAPAEAGYRPTDPQVAFHLGEPGTPIAPCKRAEPLAAERGAQIALVARRDRELGQVAAARVREHLGQDVAHVRHREQLQARDVPGAPRREALLEAERGSGHG